MTKVIFRVHNNEVIAIFPALAGDYNPHRTCLGYAHVGQHTAIVVDVMQWTRPAKPGEYQDLLKELISIGYDDLRVVKRFSHRDLQERKEQTGY